MKASVRLMFSNNEVFMGPGAKILLENIEKYSSIKEASRAMNMSYSKALKLLRSMEAELGFPVVISEKGGVNRGGTTLTDEGKKFLNSFKEIEEDVLSYAQNLTKEKFDL